MWQENQIRQDLSEVQGLSCGRPPRVSGALPLALHSNYGRDSSQKWRGDGLNDTKLLQTANKQCNSQNPFVLTGHPGELRFHHISYDSLAGGALR